MTTSSGASPQLFPPAVSDHWALFLDVDGTLVGFADHPDGVIVPDPLLRRLGALSERLDGALALVSGRELAVIDRLFRPLSLPAAGSHGLERRSAVVPAEPLPAAPAELVDIKAQAQALLATWPLAVIEDKGLALALHWRAMPEAAADLQAFALQAQARMPGYQLQHGDCVVELRPRRADKGEAIAAFLGEPPFRGRLPVFVGDDLTDEHGFEVVNARGGLSVLVGERAGSLARHRLPGVDAVHAWLGVAA